MDPIRSWIRTDPVRRALSKASSSWGRNHGWKKLGIGTLIIILICVFLVTATIVLSVFLLKALSSGSARNRDLYLPGKFINKDLYIPRIRR
jgi:ABC-type Fe3+ transport system permease subunit